MIPSTSGPSWDGHPEPRVSGRFLGEYAVVTHRHGDRSISVIGARNHRNDVLLTGCIRQPVNEVVELADAVGEEEDRHRDQNKGDENSSFGRFDLRVIFPAQEIR